MMISGVIDTYIHSTCIHTYTHMYNTYACIHTHMYIAKYIVNTTKHYMNKILSKVKTSNNNANILFEKGYMHCTYIGMYVHYNTKLTCDRSNGIFT